MSKKAIAIIIIACLLGAGQFSVAHAAGYGKGQASSHQDRQGKKQATPQESSRQYGQSTHKPPQPQQQHGQPAHKPPQHQQRYGQSVHKPPQHPQQYGQSVHKPPQHQQAHKPPSNHYNYNKYKASNSWHSHHGHFRPGYAMPAYYHHDQNRYVVQHWHSYGLYEPPSGHHWLQIDGTFILVAAATGIVAHILMGH